MTSRWWISSLITTGILLFLSTVWHVFTMGTAHSLLHHAIDIVVIGGAAIGFIYGGYWYIIHEVKIDRYSILLAWIIGSTIFFAANGLIALYVGTNQITVVGSIEVLHLTSGVGLLAGLLTGTLHTEAVRNAQTATLAKTRATALAEEQERRGQLNDLLRHYILNAVTVIDGYTKYLSSEVSDRYQPELDTIESRAQMIATLIEHINSIQNTDGEQTATQLTPVIEAVIESIESETVTVEIPGSVPTVEAVPRQLEEALSLLCNVATELIENDWEIELRCERNGETVTVSITATPATLPPGMDCAISEPIGSGLGLQVYLAQQLVDSFGRLTICENGTVQFNLDLTATGQST